MGEDPLYADFAINQAASQSKGLLSRLNNTPTFWLTVFSAFQTAAYISLGRIFDRESRYNIEQLLNTAESRSDLFSREALAVRKREGRTSDPSWLTEYLDKAHYPGANDFQRLRKKVDKHRKLYERVIRPARNKYIAHREKQDHAEVASLFSRGKVEDLWKLVVFLQQLHEVLWNLYHNGKKPRFRPMRYSITAMIKRPSTGTSAHETIVRETMQIMKMIENVTPYPTVQGTLQMRCR